MVFHLKTNNQSVILKVKVKIKEIVTKTGSKIKN